MFFVTGAELATYTIILLVVWYGSVLMLSDELDATTLLSFLLYALTVAHAIGFNFSSDCFLL
jgi:hypothetical protein